MADPIATATVEIIADTAKLTADVAAVGEKLTGYFKEAAAQSDAQLEKIGGSDVWSDLKGEASAAGESIEKDMKEAASQSNAHLDSISTKSSGAFTKAKLAVAGFSYLGVQAFRSVVDEASNLAESQNAVKVTFGDAAAGISQLGKDAAESVGLSESAFNGLAVQFSGFVSTIAGEGGDVVSTMDELTTRSADFASVMNLDVADAAALFQSGLAGETEGLRKFGIDLSGAAVEAYALANGIAAPGEEMTEQQKVQARYGLLMESTSKTAGDFANTSDGLANSQRILQAKMANLSAEVGTALLPILAKVAGFVADVVIPAIQWMGDNFEYVVAAVAGITIALIAYNATAIAAAAATALAMAPWILAAAALVALAAGVVYAYQHFETFRAIVDAIAAWFTDTLLPALQAVWDGIVTGVAALVGFVQEHWDTIMAVVQFAWDYISGIVQAAVEVVQGIIKTVMALISGDWSEVWEGIKQVLQGVWDGIKLIVETALTILTTALSLAWDGIKATLSAAWDTITSTLDTAWEGIKTTISGAIDSIVEFIAGLPGKAVEALANLGTDIGTAIGDAATDATEAAGQLVEDVLAFFTALPGNILEALGDVGSTIANGLYDAFKNVWNGIVDKIPSVSIPIPFADDPTIDIGSHLKLANGAILRQRTFFEGGEAGAEAVIPMSRPGRAMELLRQSGLGALWDEQTGGGQGGPIIAIENATFQDATDADLVAQRAIAALTAKAVAA